MTYFDHVNDDLTMGALTAGGASAIVDSLGRIWKPWLHPRDHKGRFIQTFGSVKFRTKKGGEFNDASGVVENMDRDGSIWVRIDKALSLDASQKFQRGDLVRVRKEDIEVFDAKARIAQGRGAQALRRGERTRLDSNKNSLRKLDPEQYPDAGRVADILQQVNQENGALKQMKNAKSPDQEKIAQKGEVISNLLEEAADLLDQMRGEGRQEGEEYVPGQANKEQTLLDNAFNTVTKAQSVVEGVPKARQRDAARVQGRQQERGGEIGRGDLPGADTDVNVYKDIDGNVIESPVLAEIKAVKADRASRGAPVLTDEEIYQEFIANDGLVEPRQVNGMDRVRGAFARGKEALAVRSFTDKRGSKVVPGSIVRVAAGSGRGGGFVRPEFVGMVQGLMVDKSAGGRVFAKVRDYRPEFKGMSKAKHQEYIASLPEEERENEAKRPKSYFTDGWGTYTRLTSNSLEDLSPTEDANFVALMGGLKGEYGLTIDDLSAAMIAVGGERRFAGGEAGRLSQLQRFGALAQNLRRKVDGNGRVIQQGDWVYVPTSGQYGQVTYLDPTRSTIRVSLYNQPGEPIRVSAKKVAFTSGANARVFGRSDLDAASGVGRYAPTRQEAADVARRNGLDDIADAVESGATGKDLLSVFENSDRWMLLSTQAMNLRGRMYDRGQRGLGIDPEDSSALLDASILGAAMAELFRKDDSTPKVEVVVPDSAPEFDVPAIPDGVLPEGADLGDGQIVANPEDENSVFRINPDGSIDLLEIDPETGEVFETPDLQFGGPAKGPLADGQEPPAGYERRSNGAGARDTFYTPDGRFKIQENSQGELGVVDVSDVNNPQIVGVGSDWDEVGSLIGDVSPESVPSAEASGSPEEIYSAREDAARADLSERLGTDVSDMSREEIVNTPEFAEAVQGDDYSQIAFDFNEIANAEAAQEAPPFEAPAAEPAPEPVNVPEQIGQTPDSVEAPAEVPTDGSVERGIVDNLWNVLDRMGRDDRISPKTRSDTLDNISEMEDALESGDLAQFYASADKIVRNPGVPAPIREGLARDLEALRRNGASGEDDASPDVLTDQFADQLVPLDFEPIDGIDDIGLDAALFLEDLFANMGSYLAARMVFDAADDKFWNSTKGRKKNEDRIAEAKEIRSDLEKAMTNADFSEDERRNAVDNALQRLRLFMGRGEGEDRVSGINAVGQLIASNKSGYSVRDASIAITDDEELVDDIVDVPWGDRLGDGETGYTVVDGDGNQITEGYAAEIPESRLVLDPETPLTQEQFDAWWETVPDAMVGEDGTIPSFFITTDEDGATTISVGLWSDTESDAQALAAENGDVYFDAESNSWFTPPTEADLPESITEVEAAERDLYNAIFDYEKPLSREALDDQATEINALNDAIETVKNAETVEEIDALEAEYGGPDLGDSVDDSYAAYVAARRAEVSASGSDEGWVAEVDGKPVAAVRVVRAENADEEDKWEVYLADEDSPDGYGEPLKDIDGFPYSETYEDAVARAEGVADRVRSDEAVPSGEAEPAPEAAKPERKKKAPKSPISPAARSAISDNAESMGPEGNRRLRELLAGEYPQSDEDWDLLENAVDSALDYVDTLLDQGKERLEMDGIDVPTLRGQRTALRSASRKVIAARDASDTDVPAPTPEDLDEVDVTEPDTGRGVLPRFDDAMTTKAQEKIDTTGGYSIDLSTGQDEFNEGYAVALPGRESDRYDLEDFNENAKTYTNYYITQYEKDLAEDGKVLGFWKDDEDRVVIDVSEMVDDLEEALQLGRDRNQDAIWDNKNKKEIPVPKDGAPSGPDTDPQAPGGGDDGGLPPSGGGDSGGGGTPDGGGRGGPGGGAGLSNEITAESIEGVEAVELSDQTEAPESPPKGPAPERFVAAGGTSLEDRAAKQEQYIGDGNISREVLLSDLTGNMTSEEWAAAFGGEGTAEGLSSWLKLLEQPFSPYTVALDGNPTGNVGIARTIASTVLADIPIDTDVPEYQAMREAAKQTLLGIDGLQGAEKESPLNEAEKKALLEARAAYAESLSDSESPAWLLSLARWRVATLEAVLAIDDIQQSRLWDYLDEFKGDGAYQSLDAERNVRGITRALRERVDWVNPADFMPTDAMPELGIGETAEGEISLDSVSKSLLQADVLGVDLSEATGMRALLDAVASVNRPTGGPQLGMSGPANGLTLKNGIRITPLEDGEGGVNQGLSFMVDAGGERFFLKYDYTASAAAEAITPRIVRSFGGPSPRVVPLSVDYGDLETYSLNDRQRDEERTLPRLPFLQEMAGKSLGEDWNTVGQLMSSEQAAEDINWQIEEMLGDPSTPAALDFASNLLQSLFANVVAMRWDTHDGNVMVAEDEGADGDTARIKVVPIDNGLSVPWLTMPGRTPAPDNIPQFARMMVGSRAGALVGEFAQSTTTANLTALQDSLSEWADSLREWIKTRALTDIKDGGILAGSKMDKYTKLWLQEAAALSNEEWWDILIDLNLGDPFAGYGDLFNLIDRKESVL
jgi:hypothetical protein